MRTRRGLTMMETVLGTLLVGGVLSGTLAVVGPTARASWIAGDEMIASYLASELIAEIEAQPYEDPNPSGRTMGAEPTEAGANRSKYDDVDDYNGWVAPPQTTTGVQTSGLTGSWLVSVKVVYVSAANPAVESASDTGVKRVTVSAARDGTTIHSYSTLRTRAFDTVWGMN